MSESEDEDQVVPTCKSILTTVHFGGTKKIIMECDTAASHNVLSLKAYQEISPKGSGPRLHRKNINVTLADGSRSALPARIEHSMLLAGKADLEPSANVTFMFL